MSHSQTSQFVAKDLIRKAFSKAMSDMYRTEVPAYGALLDLVIDSNDKFLGSNTALVEHLKQVENIEDLSEQRHGAIRLGKASELSMMRRIFAIMGMYPVGYYDLSVANVPVHSTAFRPIDGESVRNNPFRVFTSLLRLELIEDEQLRKSAREVLDGRDIFGDEVRALINLAEKNCGLSTAQSEQFVKAIVNVFRWHSEAAISSELYQQLLSAHPLIADVVSFKGPHINHLTPRALDIDEVQGLIHTTGAKAKAVIEGPPRRECPILLRQTAFLAIKEPVSFKGGETVSGEFTHAARFGEIEQRGCALTAKGRDLYDELLKQTRSLTRPLNDGSNLTEYLAQIADVFSAFPDDYSQMQQQQLAYFKYSVCGTGQKIDNATIDTLLEQGLVRIDPITYEDFLPVSAAGIFQSNLGEQGEQDYLQNPNKQQFEQDLEGVVADEFTLYQQIENESIAACLNYFK